MNSGHQTFVMGSIYITAFDSKLLNFWKCIERKIMVYKWINENHLEHPHIHCPEESKKVIQAIVSINS